MRWLRWSFWAVIILAAGEIILQVARGWQTHQYWVAVNMGMAWVVAAGWAWIGMRWYRLYERVRDDNVKLLATYQKLYRSWPRRAEPEPSDADYVPPDWGPGANPP